MNMLWIFLFYMCHVSVLAINEEISDMIDRINNNVSLSWKAELPTRFQNMKQFRAVLSVLKPKSSPLISSGKAFLNSEKTTAVIPNFFDARDKWPGCVSIGEVMDQGNCGSGWAVASSQVITDRICIASSATKNPRISTQDILSCCGTRCGDQCSGGFPNEALSWYKDVGVVSGGAYNSESGCMPYQFGPCVSPTSCSFSKSTVNSCGKVCRFGYSNTYNFDKYYASSVFSVPSPDTNIMMEILTNGPSVAQFNVYQDFFAYKSGVYSLTQQSTVLAGVHSVKLIGWGEENSVKYWLAVNSWGKSWGESGLFKIKRGSNEAGIEASVYGTIPSNKKFTFSLALKSIESTVLLNLAFIISIYLFNF